MFVWKDENKRKRGREWPILKKRIVYYVLSRASLLFIYIPLHKRYQFNQQINVENHPST